MRRSHLHLILLPLWVIVSAHSVAAQQVGHFNEVPVPTAPDTLNLGPGDYYEGREIFVRLGQQGICFDLGGQTAHQLRVRFGGGEWIMVHSGDDLQRITWNRPLPAPLNAPGLHPMEVEYYEDGPTTGQRFSVNVVVVPPAQRAFVSTENNTPLPPNGALGTLRHTILVWTGPVGGSTALDKPVLVVEGIDADNENSPGAYYALGARAQARLFPRAQLEGADVAILDFGDGGRRMQANAAVVRRAVEVMRQYSTDRRRGVDVIGVSMGGVVARYALAQMEQDRQLYNVDRFMSVDAPQQGAVIQPQLQTTIRQYLNQVDWPAGLARPAGRQLLQYNAFDSSSPTDHQRFYAEIRALNGGRGYPTLTTNVGVSFGTPNPNPRPGERWGRLDLDPLGGWNFDVAGSTAQAGSYLPLDVTRVMGNTLISLPLTGGTNIPPVVPIWYDFGRYDPVNPTFIPYVSALDLTGTTSRFDAPLIALSANATPSFHDRVPEDLVGPMLRRLGYELPIPPSVTISGPTELTPGETGRWRASTPDPTAGYQYNWEYQIILPGSTCGGGVVTMSSFPAGQQAPTGAPPVGGGGDDPDLIGQCRWNGGISSSAIFTYAVSSSLWLEVRVRASGWGGSRLSAVQRVCIGACDGGMLKAGEAEAVETAIRSVRPNPLRSGGEAVVEYTLAEAGPVSLVVFDALGREVARLIDGTVEAGAHSASFDASSLPAGAYVVRFEAAGVVETRLVTYTR